MSFYRYHSPFLFEDLNFWASRGFDLTTSRTVTRRSMQLPRKYAQGQLANLSEMTNVNSSLNGDVLSLT